MATAAPNARNTASARQVKEFVYAWEGKDKKGRLVRGEMRASGEALVNVTLRRQGIQVVKLKKKSFRSGLDYATECSHAVIIGAASTFGWDPGDDLIGIGDVTGLAVHAVRKVNLQALAGATRR